MNELRRAAVAVLIAVAVQAVAATEPPAQILEAGVGIAVAADGSVAAVAPEPGLPSGLSQALIKAVSEWRFTPATWHGKRVAVQEWMPLRLQPVPTTSGGYAIRILGRGSKPMPGMDMHPPAFPRMAQRAGASAALVYRVHVDREGSMSPVARLYPKALEGYLESFDASLLRAIAQSRRPPVTANGLPVACDFRIPYMFVGEDVVEPPKRPDLLSIDNECPKATLETRIKDALL